MSLIRGRKRRGMFAAAAIMLVMPVTTWAALGGDVDSVKADQVHLRASARTMHAAAYTIHEMQAAGGVTVREYYSADGRVFGVTWQGPTRPDLQQLLGQYYERFLQAVQAAKAQQVGRRPLVIEESDFVVQMGGHQRAFAGRAYVPQMVPAAASAEEIR